MVELAKFIDHTLLKANATDNDYKVLCGEAKEYGFYSVCVAPYIVKRCVEFLKGSDVKVCTVAGFPFGYSSSETKVCEVANAVSDGADEIDAVINISALKSADNDYVSKELNLLRRAAKDKILKIIIETAYLTDNEKINAAKLVAESKADFIKTSTGFAPLGATEGDIKLIKALNTGLKIKASGGIKTAADAITMINAGAQRLGTSASVNIVKAQ
jgi:deoxyribose-phosphate aldolase